MAEVKNEPDRSRAGAEADVPASRSIPEIESRVLLGEAGRVRILHRGQIYELRETRFGKLILTK